MDEKKVILLAEDDPRDIELTLRALDDYKVINEIVVVNDGEQVLDYLYRRKRFSNRFGDQPAVILLDIKMPKVSGLEVLEIIKKEDKLKKIPVVMLSSSLENPDLEKAYLLGVNAYVVKPVDFHSFINAMKSLGLFWVVSNVPPSQN